MFNIVLNGHLLTITAGNYCGEAGDLGGRHISAARFGIPDPGKDARVHAFTMRGLRPYLLFSFRWSHLKARHPGCLS